MLDRQIVRTDKTKWHKTRKCGCGDCRFYSEQERPKCPAMEADPKLVGEWLWALDPDMIGYKDYVDPLDFGESKPHVEKESTNEDTTSQDSQIFL